MKLKRISIEKLFGYISYDINLSSDSYNIISGPNGYGKTVIFNMINNIINGDFDKLEKIIFNSISLSFDNMKLTIEKNQFDGRVISDYFQLPDVNIPMLSGINIEISDCLNYDSYVFSSYLEEIKNLKILEGIIDHNKDILFKFKEAINGNNVFFITDRRLENAYIDGDGNILNQLALDLSNQMKDAILESSNNSEVLDVNYINKLAELDIEGFNILNVENRIDSLNELKRKLIDYGFFENAYINDDYISSLKVLAGRNQLGIANLYVDDCISKYKPILNLVEKIDLLFDLINKFKFAFKKIKFSKDSGFYFVDKFNGKNIPLTKLSSGEKSLLILYYGLIFKAYDSIVLIDEPEISLHPAWQEYMFDYFKKIEKVNNLTQVIIATHSGHIVGSAWDNVFDLYENIIVD